MASKKMYVTMHSVSYGGQHTRSLCCLFLSMRSHPSREPCFVHCEKFPQKALLDVGDYECLNSLLSL